MQLNQRLHIKHSQSIVMTPQLRQAIKLLQFSNLELSNYIEEEIEKNPFLEKNIKNDVEIQKDSSFDKASETEQRWDLSNKKNNNTFQYDEMKEIKTKKNQHFYLKAHANINNYHKNNKNGSGVHQEYKKK